MKIKLGKHIFSNDHSDHWTYHKEGSEYYYFIRSVIFHFTTHIQKFLYKRKIYWHNWFIDECTPGFECCRNKMTDKEKSIVDKIVYASMEEIPYVCINKEEL